MKVESRFFISVITNKRLYYLSFVFDDGMLANFYPYIKGFDEIVRNNLWIGSKGKWPSDKLLRGDEAISFLVSRGPLFSEI